MTDDPILLWTVRHRHCQRFVRMARVRDFLMLLLGRPMYIDEACEDCARGVDHG